MKTTVLALVLALCSLGLSRFSSAENAGATPPRIAPADAKSHNGEVVTVCGKVVDTLVPKYGVGGRGKPVHFDLDQPEPSPIFFFVAFGSKEGGPQEVVSAYKDKQVCVTGKVNVFDTTPFIMADDRTKIKAQSK